jgi:hypothetical protein
VQQWSTGFSEDLIFSGFFAVLNIGISENRNCPRPIIPTFHYSTIPIDSNPNYMSNGV